MREITIYNIDSCSPSKCYVLIGGDNILYKLQAVDNINSYQKENCNFAFCCLDDSVYYGYGVIDTFHNAIRKILKHKNTILLELENIKEIINFFAQKTILDEEEMKEIEKIKWNVSVKKGYDIGLALASMMYIAGHTSQSTSNN